MLTEVLWALGPAILASALLTPAMRRLAMSWGAVDHPGPRSVHRHPVPYLGGLALYGGFAVALGFFWLVRGGHLPVGDGRKLVGVLLGASLVVLMGVVDDLGRFWVGRFPALADHEGRGLRPVVKLAVEALAGLVLVSFGVAITGIHLPFHPAYAYLSFGWLAYPLTILWVISITNAVNLIDGLDGLASGITGIAALTLLAVALLSMPPGLAAVGCAALLGICVGFLPWNFHPARIFMGDAGALFLGFALSAVAVMGLPLKSVTVMTVAVPALAVGVPVFDTVLAILRRWRTHQQVGVADRAHTHHRLLELGLSHREAVVALYMASGWLGVSALAIERVGPGLGAGILAFVIFSGALVARLVGVAGRRQVTRAAARSAPVRTSGSVPF